MRNHIGNITFELCDTEVPGMRYDKVLGGIQKYIQHQRYWIHVLKADHDEMDKKNGLYDRFALWVEIRKWFKVLNLESTMDTTPFTEKALQEAGMKADRLFKLPRVEGAKHALNELLKEWCGAKIVTLIGIEMYNKFMGGTDRCDSLRGFNTTQRKSVKWWHSLLFWALDIAYVNAYAVSTRDLVFWAFSSSSNLFHGN